MSATTLEPTNTAAVDAAAGTDLQAQAEMILSALDAGQFAGEKADRRGTRRRRLRVQAMLRLFSDGPQTPAWALFTRDVHGRGLGFITPHRLPLGYGGILQLPSPDNRMLTIACTLLRCREAAPGWFEGSLYFNREQACFSV